MNQYKGIANLRPNSDIDVALYGEIDTSQMLAIHHEWDELPLPDKFDLAIYSTLSYDDLKRHIDDQGRTLYSKTSQTFTTPKRQ